MASAIIQTAETAEQAFAYAYAYAYADANAYAKIARRQEAYARLANGMVECLRRVPSAEAPQ